MSTRSWTIAAIRREHLDGEPFGFIFDPSPTLQWQHPPDNSSEQ